MSYFRQDFLQTDPGADLWFQVQGDGEPSAVLCDGLGCDGFVWKYLLPVLRQNQRVLRWHYRGHGQSGVPADASRIGMEFSCSDLLRLMDHAGLERSVIFGHSMGVQVALEFHRRHASRVAGLVLLCGSYGNPLDTWHDHSLLRKAFPLIRAAVEKAPHLARRITSRLKTSVALEFSLRTELNRDLLARDDFWPYLEHLSKMDPLMFVRTLDSLKDHSAWDHLPHVDVPVLVVGGEIDRFTPVWLSERMANHIPGCDYLFVPGGSHTAPLERSSLVNDRIQHFLQTRVGPARLSKSA
ncbi:MAG: alpha/beta fold family hydrolase [Myxococcaceae bacterium]|nr:alpha/beta fold family hydrolase [Myxococcaceae bacterium]